jgi:glycerol uptake facilitator-like aquaporin
MIMAGTFTSAWVYVVAPVVGGILAAWLYDHCLAQADAPKS